MQDLPPWERTPEENAEDDAYFEWWLSQQPEMNDEQLTAHLKRLDECADLIRKTGMSPNLDGLDYFD